ncbi:MAG: hypothetical protein PHG49_01420 [Candidatus Pacebacteria bacterium]|nr:hypothetical protein [Candidatus Paceibacterota bacterium]
MPTFNGADKFSAGGLAVGVTQAPLAIKPHTKIKATAQILIAAKRNGLLFCFILF